MNNTEIKNLGDDIMLSVILKETMTIEPTYQEIIQSLPKVNRKRKDARENDYPEFDEYIKRPKTIQK